MRENEQAHHPEPLPGDTASQEGEAPTASAETPVAVESTVDASSHDVAIESGVVDLSSSSADYTAEGGSADPGAAQASSHSMQPQQQPVPVGQLLLLALRNLQHADIITDPEI